MINTHSHLIFIKLYIYKSYLNIRKIDKEIQKEKKDKGFKKREKKENAR